MFTESNGGYLLPMIEPIPIPDTMVTGRMIQDCGDVVRITAYCDRPSASGETERVVVARWILTKSDYRHFLRDIAPMVRRELGLEEGGIYSLPMPPMRGVRKNTH